MLSKRQKIPETEKTYNRRYLVTIHQGGRTWVAYHGNNVNIVNQVAYANTRPVPKKRRGARNIAKIWMLVSATKQEGIEDAKDTRLPLPF